MSLFLLNSYQGLSAFYKFINFYSSQFFLKLRLSERSQLLLVRLFRSIALVVDSPSTEDRDGG